MNPFLSLALVYYLEANHPTYNKKLIYFSGRCGGQYKNYKNFMEERLCSHKHDFGISAEGISAHCDGIGGAGKRTCGLAKRPKVFE